MARDRAPAVIDADPPIPITLRRATLSDRAKVLAWRNDPWLVSLSASQRTVGEQEHARWFSRVLSDPNALLLVIESGGNDIGTVRIDKADETRAFLTVYLLRQFTRQGLGTAAIREAVRRAFDIWPHLEGIHARIRTGNAGSVSAFRKAGFNECSPDQRLESDTATFVEMVMARLPK
jgi:RimJ/RimL family protein N-acetyltransferase